MRLDPLEGVVGDFLPSVLAQRVVRAAGELLVVDGRLGLGLAGGLAPRWLERQVVRAGLLEPEAGWPRRSRVD